MLENIIQIFQYSVEILIDFSTFLEENSIDSNKKIYIYIYKLSIELAASNHVKFKR